MPGGRVLSRKASIWVLFIAPLLLLVLITYAAPLAGVASWSVTRPAPGLENYAEIAGSAQVHTILWRTLRICLASSVIATALAFILAVAWTFGGPALRTFVEIGVLVPFWISVLVRALGWLVLLRNNGVVNTALLDLGAISSPLALVRNELGVLIGMVHFLIPFAVFPILANMRKLDTRLLAAARGLGAGRWFTFRTVFLPLMRPGILGAFVMVLVFSLGFFVTPAILGGGRVVMVAEYVFIQITQTSRWGFASAIAVLLFALVGALLLVLLRINRSGRGVVG
jgi:putative spermidine/putrescine transport system permease protein